MQKGKAVKTIRTFPRLLGSWDICNTRQERSLWICNAIPKKELNDKRDKKVHQRISSA